MMHQPPINQFAEPQTRGKSLKENQIKMVITINQSPQPPKGQLKEENQRIMN